MSAPSAEVVVWCHTDAQPERVGTLWLAQRRDQVSATFSYDSAWQSARHGHAISPDLGLATTRHHLDRLPGALADCSPDRWGRGLIDKRRRAIARQDGSTPASVSEVDYLLGVSDVTRQGALRLSAAAGGRFLANDTGVPPMLELPRLLRAADAAASYGDSTDAVKALLDAGSASLGGARPKASVRDGDRLAIAKFPHASDQWDVMTWEKTALDLAELAGIRVPRRQLVPIGARHALVLDRFDRGPAGRVEYISAMTLVGGHDGGSYDYLEVAEALAEHGGSVSSDLGELWRRIAFTLLVNNADDHLRNHGFLRQGGGWRLSPAFDLNPDPAPSARHATTVCFSAGGRQDALEALMDGCAEFGLSRQRAGDVLAEVTRAVARWREIAGSNGATPREIERFADAFDATGRPQS